MGFGKRVGVLWGLVVFFALVSVFASAGEVTVDVRPVKDSVIQGEQAAFELVLHNNQDFPDTFRFSTLEVAWDVVSDPLYHYFSGVEIPAKSSETVRILLISPGKQDYGQYQFFLSVSTAKSKQRVSIPLYVTLRPEHPLIREYLAAVNRIVEIPSVIDPRMEVPVSVNLVNRNPKNLTDVRVVFSSVLINREITTTLNPLEKKVLSEVFSLNPLTAPQNDTLEVRLYVDGTLLEPVIREKFLIGSYGEVQEIFFRHQKYFMKVVEEHTLKNVGNAPAPYKLELESGRLRSMFTKTDPEAYSISRGGKKVLAWEGMLQPGESIEVTKKESYRSLLLLAALIAASGIAYIIFRSPVSLIKRANILRLKEGGISELKLIIHVKNRGSESFDRLTVIESLPIIADVVSDEDLGSAKPTSISHDGKHTTVKWELDKLEAGEERLLSYRMQSRLSIIGSVTLPPAILRFYSAKGTKLITRSRSVNVKA